MSVRYLHPDKVHSVSKVLRGKKKSKSSDGLSMIERLSRQLYAEKMAPTGKTYDSDGSRLPRGTRGR